MIGYPLAYLLGDHVSIQLQLPNLNFLYLDSCNWTPTVRARQSAVLKWILLAFSTLFAKLILHVPKVLS